MSKAIRSYSTSRRAVLVGTAAAVVAAAAPVSAARFSWAAQASEPLIALEAQLVEARTDGVKVAGLWSAAYDKAGDWASGWPMADFDTPAVNLMRGWLRCNGFHGANENRVSLDCVKRFNGHNETLMLAYAAPEELLAQCKAEGRERIRWWIKARRVQKAAQEAAGVPEAEALLESNHEREDAIEAQLWDTQAETLQGVLIRMREANRDYVAVQCSNDDGDFYARIFGKVLADLERLAGEDRS